MRKTAEFEELRDFYDALRASNDPQSESLDEGLRNHHVAREIVRIATDQSMLGDPRRGVKPRVPVIAGWQVRATVDQYRQKEFVGLSRSRVAEHDARYDYDVLMIEHTGEPDWSSLAISAVHQYTASGVRQRAAYYTKLYDHASGPLTHEHMLRTHVLYGAKDMPFNIDRSQSASHELGPERIEAGVRDIARELAATLIDVVMEG